MATIEVKDIAKSEEANAEDPHVIPPDDDDDDEGEGEAMVLTDLCILPPLQKEGTVTWDEMQDAIVLPPLRPEEPVASIRAVLGEVCGYAHLTNFRFVLEDTTTTRKQPPKAKTKLNLPVVSPYTGPDAVVSVPVSVRSFDVEPHLPEANGGKVTIVSDASYKGAVVLDEYADLTSLLDKGLQDGSCIRLILERYDAASVRDQVTKVRLLLQGNAPFVTTLVEDEEMAATQPSQEESSTNSSEVQKKQEKGPKEVDSSDKQQDKPLIPELPTNWPAALDGTNLKDFYYLACGEEDSLYEKDNPSSIDDLVDEQPKSPRRKKNKGKKKESGANSGTTPYGGLSTMSLEATERRLNELEEDARIQCTVRYSGFHPPPNSRRLLGDLAYIEVIPPAFPDEPILNITAVPMGFNVNRSSVDNGSYTFDPSPAPEPCFSHELLDCMLQASDSIRSAWETALVASKERAELSAVSNRDNPLFALHRVAVRGNYGGFQHSSTAAVSQDMDSIILRPSWLVPLPITGEVSLEEENAWNHNSLHDYNPAYAEIELSNTFGLDARVGPVRDWNEELQSAREMPRATRLERIERARMIHKVMVEFGEAALFGVKGICNNLISPMNPNEPARSHVYLHNNIFFSRGLDAGVETFKVHTGDNCARKAASRDAQCMSTMHRLDVSGLHTLATVLVDYLGTRFICQCIVPGILHGDKTHTLLYGAVDAASPLAWDENLHKRLEETIGKTFMIASRPLPTHPLTEERLQLVEKMKTLSPFLPVPEKEEAKEVEDLPVTRNICGPVEAKGIRGSDKRMYVLDMTRLTPRDANWVPKSKGGTGKWEAVFEETSVSAGKKKHVVPASLDDDEWTMALLRPELITLYTRRKMAEYRKNKEKVKGKDSKSEDNSSKEKTASDPETESGTNAIGSKRDGEDNDEKPTSKNRELSPEDQEYMNSMRLNVNVFLPIIKSVVEVDETCGPQLDDDMERIREVSAFLWDTMIPTLTRDIREGVNQQVAIDGRSLTEMLHQRGINCRYLGRLASLAAAEERKDREDDAAQKRGQLGRLPRRTMPPCWLEMLECEMVARAAKHVLDCYLTENGGVAAGQPAQAVAAFLSALVSSSEETAGETETRLRKEESTYVPDEDDLVALTVFDVGGEGDAVPAPIRSRKEVWDDIEREVGRRFRYSLTLYNQDGSGSRALYIPLLRRICQRTGIRLVAKPYAVGGKCLCSTGNTSGGRITPSYPISPLDVIEIVPLVKHAAAHGAEGFVPCSFSTGLSLPSLHILLPDASNALEAAQAHYVARMMPQALDLAQEAAQLYQRVTDSPLHASILRCLDLTSAILFDASEAQLAAGNASRALALSVQLGGFDCTEAVSCHSTMSHILISSGSFVGGVRHLRAAMYLMELMAGPRYAELSSYYNKLGTLYHQLKQPETALRYVQEASRRYSSDRLMEGMLANSMAVVLGNLGRYKAAVESEKRAYQFYAGLLGEEHELTKRCGSSLQDFTKLAVAQGSKQMSEEKIRQKEAEANAIADEIEAEEEHAVKKHKKNRKKKNKK